MPSAKSDPIPGPSPNQLRTIYTALGREGTAKAFGVAPYVVTQWVDYARSVDPTWDDTNPRAAAIAEVVETSVNVLKKRGAEVQNAAIDSLLAIIKEPAVDPKTANEKARWLLDLLASGTFGVTPDAAEDRALIGEASRVELLAKVRIATQSAVDSAIESSEVEVSSGTEPSATPPTPEK